MSDSMINLHNPEIMSAKDASMIWHKNPDYVRASINSHPEKWPRGSWRKFGNTIVVTRRGMEEVTGIAEPRQTTAH